jgi:hypothetical protein
MRGEVVEIDIVPGAVALRREIEDVLGRLPAIGAAVLHDVEAGPLQGRDLQGVVGVDGDLRDAELLQHLGREVEAALVEAEAQHLVGVIGVPALALQLIGAHLVGDAVAAPFLVQIKQHASAVLGHEAHRPAQLVAAVAFQASEQVAGEAGRMQPDRNGLREVGRPDDDGDLVAQALAAAEDHELGLRSPVQRHRGAADDLDGAGEAPAVAANRLGFDAEKSGGRALGVQRHGDHRRQQERQRGELQRHDVEGAGGADRRIDAGVDLERQRLDPREVHGRQRDHAGRGALHAEPAQAGGRQHEMRRAEPSQRGGEGGLERFDARGDQGLVPVDDDDGASGAELRNGPFNAGVYWIAEKRFDVGPAMHDSSANLSEPSRPRRVQAIG